MLVSFSVRGRPELLRPGILFRHALEMADWPWLVFQVCCLTVPATTKKRR